MESQRLDEFPEFPYPGLRPFEPNEWPIFFGREKLIAELIEEMGRKSLLVVHGGSGCGKSSIVRAGILPSVLRDYEMANRKFSYGIFRPREGPVEGLISALANSLSVPADNEPSEWWSDQLLFADDIGEVLNKQVIASGLNGFCLVIDQFEEIFHWAKDYGRSDVQLLVDVLGKLENRESADQRFFTLLTMRSDYLGQCAQFDGLNKIINKTQYFLPNLGDRGIFHAITEPAKLFGGEVSAALADKLRFALRGNVAPLPILQHALMQMTKLEHTTEKEWEISSRDLENIGGLRNAISVHADAIFNELVLEEGPEIRDGLNWFFRSLVEIDAGGLGRRRPQSVEQLRKVTGFDEEQMAKVIRRFSSAGRNFLTVSDHDGVFSNQIVDISHEALIHNWRKMNDSEDEQNIGWLTEELRSHLVWRYFAVAADDYKSGTGATLSSAAVEGRVPWMENLQKMPERARRYLVYPDNIEYMENEPEWKSVISFWEASCKEKANQERRAKRAKIFSVALAMLAIATGIFAIISKGQTEFASEQDAVIQTGESIEGSALAAEVAAGDPMLQQQEEDGLFIQQTSDAKNVNRDYFIWVGSDNSSQIAESKEACSIEDAILKPSSLQQDSRFVVCTNIVVRSGPPDENNKSAPGVGVVLFGSEVVALEKPTERDRPSGTQFWAKVKVTPVEFPQVILTTAGTSNEREAVFNKLSGMGYTVTRGGTPFQQDRKKMVYYCDLNDRKKANRLAATVRDALFETNSTLGQLTRYTRSCDAVAGQDTLLVDLD